jgi:phosphate transport system permease protein
MRRTRRLGDRVGDRVLYGLTAGASLLGVLVIAAIAWRVADGAWPAIRIFHLSFLWHNDWNAVTSRFGARWFIVGTLVTSLGAHEHAAPPTKAIRLYLNGHE